MFSYIFGMNISHLQWISPIFLTPLFGQVATTTPSPVRWLWGIPWRTAAPRPRVAPGGRHRRWSHHGQGQHHGDLHGRAGETCHGWGVDDILWPRLGRLGLGIDKQKKAEVCGVMFPWNCRGRWGAFREPLLSELSAKSVCIFRRCVNINQLRYHLKCS